MRGWQKLQQDGTESIREMIALIKYKMHEGKLLFFCARIYKSFCSTFGRQSILLGALPCLLQRTTFLSQCLHTTSGVADFEFRDKLIWLLIGSIILRSSLMKTRRFYFYNPKDWRPTACLHLPHSPLPHEPTLTTDIHEGMHSLSADLSICTSASLAMSNCTQTQHYLFYEFWRQ